MPIISQRIKLKITHQKLKSAITLMGNFPFIVIDLIPYRSLKTAFF
ncbi:hypothetical protein O53_4258 [Microcystis aeruginosa TAIHU98]|uniref:Uncharacterized protein n=1 Tax=Microcystis aeruginosa TAIHU98 TaxID=1134457 RepID=L7E1J6_MICAE|nr:hypothetical protein O53_4258 [Microcystis aeruginosa TAIHU98]